MTSRCARWAFSAALSLLVLLSAFTAAAQNRFDVQQFNPMPGQRFNYLGQASAGVMPHGIFEVGILVDYADDPLVIRSLGVNEERLGSVVSRQLTTRALFAVGLFDRLELGVELPVVVLQEGGSPAALQGSTIEGGAGLSDIRFVPSIRFVGPTGDEVSGIALGMTADLFFPIGDEDNFRGEGFRAHPRLALDYTFANSTRLGINLGYMVRPEATFANVEVDDVLTASAAADFYLTDWFRLVPEISTEFSVLADSLDSEEQPVEGLLALRFFPVFPLMVEAGAGRGINSGFGTPDWRAFLGITYTNMRQDRDSDGDGYLDSVDGCPLEPEDFDDFDDEDGCPDPDNDFDGIPDVSDECPMQPEDYDTFQDEDGCPDLDNDWDGIPDIDDECPMHPEDYDTFEDTDGCPDPDNDEDGILDIDDMCPLEPETFNNHEDEDGCPDSALVVVVPCVAVELNERVYFDTDSDVIQERSYALLQDLRQALVGNPGILRVRVEGHTDDRGSARYNQGLSERRAAAVMRHLVDGGVAPDRLESAGLGEDRPMDTNATEAGRQNNRRVEVHIVEQEGCE